MKVLVACEESQRVCVEFRKLGHEAFSCDIQEPSGGHPEWHILCDVLKILDGGEIITMDGKSHVIGKWDLLIAHPPCTFLSNAGSMRLIRIDSSGNRWLNFERYQKALNARVFFERFLSADIPYICVENPAPIKLLGLPKYTQIIEPYYFGDPWKKRTCLWLRGLPLLKNTDMVEPLGCWVDAGKKGRTNRTKLCGLKGVKSAKERSKTFPGIAKAMAQQWSCV